MKDKLEELRELIFRCEEVEKDACINEHAQLIHQDHSVEYFKQYRSLNLEDVLRAVIKKFSDCGIITKDTYHETFCEFIDTWLLGKPLQDQSEECIDSLIKLL